jgi:hypothetical protein
MAYHATQLIYMHEWYVSNYSVKSERAVCIQTCRSFAFITPWTRIINNYEWLSSLFKYACPWMISRCICCGAVSNCLLQRSQWDRGSSFHSFNEAPEADSAVSMRPRKWLRRLQWDRGSGSGGFNETAESIKKISTTIFVHRKVVFSTNYI